jgi:hypothetical protein
VCRAKKPALRVEFIHCAILLGHVEDILIEAVLGHPDLDMATKTAVIRAVNKVDISDPPPPPERWWLTCAADRLDPERPFCAPLHQRCRNRRSQKRCSRQESCSNGGSGTRCPGHGIGAISLVEIFFPISRAGVLGCFYCFSFLWFCNSLLTSRVRL